MTWKDLPDVFVKIHNEVAGDMVQMLDWHCLLGLPVKQMSLHWLFYLSIGKDKKDYNSHL